MGHPRNAMKLCWFALAVTLAAIAGQVTASSSTPARFTVVTYNIRYDNPADGPDGWAHRRDTIVDYLRSTSADIIGLQEAEPHQRAFLAEHLGEYGWYGIGRNAEHDEGEGTPIFYRRSRFDAGDRGTFWLSTSPALAGSRSWDAALPRVASWMIVRDRRTGRRLLVVNTHFDHRGPEARLRSADLLVDRIVQLAGTGAGRLPVVVLGDFNSRPDEAPYRALTASRGELTLFDARHASRTPHQGGDSTSNAFKAIAPGARIDYVFVRDLDVVSHRIEDPRIRGRFASDHQPVVAVLDNRSRP
jgi:endonuclease/exonuclease/phosphatase family metal-dependent hydrolase